LNEHNKAYNEGKVGYYVGLNQYSDWVCVIKKRCYYIIGFLISFTFFFKTKDEIESFTRTSRGHETIDTPSQKQHALFKRSIYADVPAFNLNKSIDWQMLGYVTPAKESQGKCGSCTAYAIVGALEAQYFKQTQILKSFSEQFLVDCNLLTPNVCLNGASLVDRM